MTLFLSSIEGLMGLKEEQSVSQLFLYEGFLIESRYRAGNPFNEGFFLGPDKMGEALILPTVQQMRDVATNQCWKPLSYSKREPSTF